MFGFLKKKLKEAVSKFSRKVEEEVKPEEVVKEELKEEKRETEELKEQGKEKLIKQGPKLEETKALNKEEATKNISSESIKEKSAKEIIKTKSEAVPKPKAKETEKLEESEETTKTEALKSQGLNEKSETEISQQEITQQSEESNKNIFGRLKELVAKKTLSEGEFEALFWDIELVLLENNVALQVVEKIKNDLKEKLLGKKVFRRRVQQIIEETLRESIREILNVPTFNILDRIKEKKTEPFVILFLGINGSGKTTTIAKLTYLLKQNQITTVLAAGDTFRAAAIQQLEEHAKKLGVKLIKHNYGSDSAAVAYDTIEYAKAHNLDSVLIDTAGRLHSNKNLMEELKKIVRVTKPDLKVFVGESITGNDCVQQAEAFNKEIGIDAIILTKADIDEKGGAALSISYVTKKPIIFIGTGQDYTDLSSFESKKVEESLFA